MKRWFDRAGPLRTAARWLFLATLIYAPWAYGCTTPETIAVLNKLLAVVLGLWIADLLVTRRLPIVLPSFIAITTALLAIGWWMVLNAPTIHDSDLSVFMPRAQPFPKLPGSVDQVLSAAWMVRATLLLGVAWFVSDLALRPLWLMRLWGAASIAGGSVALLGLLQKASGARTLFWGDAPPVDGIATFFGSYYYHANAGVFLNLAMPVAVGLGIRVLDRPGPALARALWPASAFCLLLAVIANTSRVSQMIGVSLMLALAVLWLRARVGATSPRDIPGILAGIAVVMATAFAVAQASQLDQPLLRWGQLRAHLPADSRWLAALVAWRGAPEAGWFGFGPGTFRVVFPYFAGYVEDGLTGEWRFLHEDYLQTVVEWGHAGAALWGAFFFGGIAVAMRNLRSKRANDWMPRRKIVLPLIVLALLATAVHALVDFPLQIASLQLYVATYLGICWGSLAWTDESAAEKQSTPDVTAPGGKRKRRRRVQPES